MSSLRKHWKRGARKGNYKPIQWNIACRVKNMGMPNGNAANDEPKECETTTQAKISLGYLPRGFCGVRYEVSICTGVDGPGQSASYTREQRTAVRNTYIRKQG